VAPPRRLTRPETAATLLALAGLLAACAGPARSIRSVDFGELRYDLAGQEVQLHDGEHRATGPDDWNVSRVEVSYGDLTGDGREEAAVVVRFDGGGSGSFSSGFVYALAAGEPTLLARFDGGDRADGGILEATVSGAELVVERERGTALCCAEEIVTTRYRLGAGGLEEVSEQARPAR
jgi:hypothetical protein